jgi:DNA-binding XRE family transcriptional regulator
MASESIGKSALPPNPGPAASPVSLDDALVAFRAALDALQSQQNARPAASSAPSVLNDLDAQTEPGAGNVEQSGPGTGDAGPEIAGLSFERQVGNAVFVPVSEIGALMAKVRKQLGLTQTQLAYLAGTSQSAIARLEAGGSASMNLGTAEKIFGAMNFKVVLGLVSFSEQ